MKNHKLRKGVVTYRAPDLTYVKIKDCAGGNFAYIHGADTIKSLDLGKGGNKIVIFTYKHDVPTEVDRIQTLQEDFSCSNNGDLPRKDTSNIWMRGTVTFLHENWSFLVIKACKTGESAYFPDAYDTVRKLRLEKPENRTVVFERNPNKPNQVLRVELC